MLVDDDFAAAAEGKRRRFFSTMHPLYTTMMVLVRPLLAFRIVSEREPSAAVARQAGAARQAGGRQADPAAEAGGLQPGPQGRRAAAGGGIKQGKGMRWLVVVRIVVVMVAVPVLVAEARAGRQAGSMLHAPACFAVWMATQADSRAAVASRGKGRKVLLYAGGNTMAGSVPGLVAGRQA